MANNLKDHLKEVADAIRAKKGTSDLINPQDFATEIEGITVGGGDAPSGDNWKYYRCTSPSAYSNYFIGAYNIVRVENTQLPNAVFVDSGLLMYMSKNDSTLFESCVAMAINMNEKITNMQTLEIKTKGDVNRDNIDVVVSRGEFIEITKEQFYDLNA